jgi:uncharacterized membrane protein/protein-disulfide isomerase
MSKYGRPLLLVLALAALAASVASLYVHYQLIADPTYVSFCDVNETVSCEAVYKSSYGTMFGVPVAAGGAIWAALVLALVGYGMRSPQSATAGRAAGYVFLLSVIGLASVFYFAYASFFVLQKTCPLCVAVYISVAGIFIVSSAIAPPKLGSLFSGIGDDVTGLLKNPTALGVGALWLLGSVALVALFPSETIREDGTVVATPAPVATEVLDQAQLAEWHAWLDKQPRVPQAMPPAGVKVLVLKFNDYQCPACRMTYLAYKDIFDKYEASNPGEFRYETRDFPLEGECGLGGVHGGACEAAVAVRLAKAKDPAKGKQLEDWLFDRQPSMSRDLVKEGLAEIAQVNSFDADYPKTLEAVRADVKLGQELGVNGTPAFFINGIRVEFSMRPAYLDAAIAYLLNKT